MNELSRSTATPVRALPARPNLDHLKNEAKLRLKELRKTDPTTKLATAQFTLARDYGFASWRSLRAHVETLPPAALDQLEEIVAQRRYEQSRPRKERPIDPKLLDSYVGYYQLSEHLIFSITREENRLFSHLTGQSIVEIFPESDRVFFYKVVPAQLEFATDAQGTVSNLVLHQNGYEQVAKRIDDATAINAAENLARRIREGTPWPGSEAALRRVIDEQRRGQPDYEKMGEGLALAARQQAFTIQQNFAALGELQSVAFKGVARNGWDVFDVHFAGGDTEWRIKLADNGKVDGLFYRFLP